MLDIGSRFNVWAPQTQICLSGTLKANAAGIQTRKNPWVQRGFDRCRTNPAEPKMQHERGAGPFTGPDPTGTKSGAKYAQIHWSGI
jgi:hypothetical protein